MKTFLHKYSSDVMGVLSGFDRLVFRGTLTQIAHPVGMTAYLNQAQVLLKEFANHVHSVSTRVKEASKKLAGESARPFIYLQSSKTNKEKEAREQARKHPVDQGLICVLSCVEPCYTFQIRGEKTKGLELVKCVRKCLHFYHYAIHPVFGFMHARLQTWFPFTIQIALNGREWLARQMDQLGLSYQRKDNCFPWVEDFSKAQQLMDQQLKLLWPQHLDDVARLLNPAHDEIFKAYPSQYYWTIMQSEWATDIMFRSTQSLAKHFPTLVHHGMTTFSSPDVMRFLGKNIPPTGNIPPAFAGEVVTDMKRRPEGIRIKHRVKKNALKLYDKQGSVLRAETTINDPSDFKVFREKQSPSAAKHEWLPLRKGVVDIKRRAEVSQNANERYLEALACAKDSTPLKTWTDRLCAPVTWKAKRFRALNPFAPDDAQLLTTVIRGEFAVNGFTNKDIRPFIHGPNLEPQQDRKASAKVTRQLRLLRAHGLIRKAPNCHRYHLTPKGRQAITALLTARQADTASLTKLAA